MYKHIFIYRRDSTGSILVIEYILPYKGYTQYIQSFNGFKCISEIVELNQVDLGDINSDFLGP